MADTADTATSVPFEPAARVAPAFSATSDAPQIPAAAPAVEAKPAEGEAPPADAAALKTEDTDAKPVITKDDLPPPIKAEITKARNQKREADAKAAAAEAKADQLTASLTRALESIDALTKAQAARISAEAEKEDPRPTRDAFDNPDAYDTALIDWSSRRATLIARTEAQKAVADGEAKAKADQDKVAADKVKADQDARNRETVEAFTARKDKFAADHPDYADVAEKDDLQISIPMAQAIMQDEDGPAIAYYLGQNPDEADRISKLSPVRQVAELGRIAQKLNAPPPVSTKPAPINPLKSGSGAAVSKSISEMSMDEYAAQRSPQIRASMGLRNGAAVTH